LEQLNLFGEVVTKRDLPPVDIHMSGAIASAAPACCITVSHGFGLGLCSDANTMCKRCQLTFVDNPFMGYKHEKHFKFVFKHNPKYATVRDYFSQEQCDQRRIEYIDLETLVGHCNELIDHGILPIIIPKNEEALKEVADLSRIDEYVVGYSLAKQFGQAKRLDFKGYVDSGFRIHLLGGRPEVQIEYYNQYPDNIVSMDTAVISTLAVNRKQIWRPKDPSFHYDFGEVDKFLQNNTFKDSYASSSLTTACSIGNLYVYLKRKWQ
jgi:hypothetical protein